MPIRIRRYEPSLDERSFTAIDPVEGVTSFYGSSNAGVIENDEEKIVAYLARSARHGAMSARDPKDDELEFNERCEDEDDSVGPHRRCLRDASSGHRGDTVSKLHPDDLCGSRVRNGNLGRLRRNARL